MLLVRAAAPVGRCTVLLYMGAEKVVGADNVLDPGLITGAEDFSFFARQVPGLYFFVGVTPKGKDAATAPSNHSPEFYIDEQALDVGLRAMLQASLDYLHGGS